MRARASNACTRSSESESLQIQQERLDRRWYRRAARLAQIHPGSGWRDSFVEQRLNPQAKMREAVSDGRELAPGLGFHERSFRKAPQAAPDSGRRPALEKHASRLEIDEPGGLSQRQGLSHPRRRQLGNAASFSRDAAPLNR